jgi:hypothetical protein
MVQNLYLFITLCYFLFNNLTYAQVYYNGNTNNQEISRSYSDNSSIQNKNHSVNHLEQRINIKSSSSTENETSLNKVTIDYGLIFEKEYEFRLENNSYTDIMQLISLSDTAQALQFRLLVNKAADDSTILIFENIEKGTDVSDPNWILDYNVFKGPILPNGASKDEVYVLLYNLTQNGGLLPGDYDELLKVSYKVVDLPDLQDSIKSSMKISNAQASTSQGLPIDITPSRDELKIYAKVPVVYPDHGLIFEKDTVFQLEDDSYTEIMQLKDLNAKVQALQFRLLVNKAIDDNTILTFQNIQKGSDISDPSWVLDYNVFRGPLTGNGASVDEIFVLLYNLNQNNGLPEGDYDELLKVKYRIADLPALQDSIKSAIKISNTDASTYQGNPIDITPSRDELTVIARNRVGFYGDVNGDGCLDILDIIMIVDHIVGRDSLDADEFARADIAPWVPGNPYPYSDGIVNVQDLSLLQNIILTGVYPDGTPINGCNYSILPKINGVGNTVTFYINNEGITAYLNSNVDIRGVQIEFGGVGDDPNSMVINTDLGQGYYKKVNELLRVLLYDRQGTKVFETGENLLADMPFHITRPEDITIEKLILIDVNRQKIVDNEVVIIYGTPPSLPIDFILYQNYPNPFNPATTIEYSLPKKCDVLLKVYDVLGTEVAILVDDEKNRGNYSVIFNASGLAGGVYFYRLQVVDPSTGSGQVFVETKKMILLK